MAADDSSSPSKPKKVEDIHLRVAPEHKAAWEVAARRERRSLSSFITMASDYRANNPPADAIVPIPGKKQRRRRSGPRR
jgi:hypothetical protein